MLKSVRGNVKAAKERISEISGRLNSVGFYLDLQKQYPEMEKILEDLLKKGIVIPLKAFIMLYRNMNGNSEAIL